MFALLDDDENDKTTKNVNDDDGKNCKFAIFLFDYLTRERKKTNIWYRR